MAGRIQPIQWGMSAQALYDRYVAERDLARRKRLQVLWRVRSGRTATQAAQEAGVGLRTVTRWLDWYRAGGLDSVLWRGRGGGGPGQTHPLAAADEGALPGPQPGRG